MRLVSLLLLLVLLTGCNIVIKGDHFDGQFSDGLTATRVEMENFTITIPVRGIHIPPPGRQQVDLDFEIVYVY